MKSSMRTQRFAVPSDRILPLVRSRQLLRPCVRRHRALTKSSAHDIVDEVLEKIADTDSGLTITDERRREVDALLERLELIGEGQQPRPLKNPAQLFGNFNVAYTSTSQSPDKGQPAGGRFRSKMGRSVFRTTGLFQSVIAPNVVTNKVAFKLLDALPGAVALRGRIGPKPQSGDDDTVEVLFDPPVLTLPGDLHIRIGPPSSVVLKTTYLDDRVRLGKGSRGSRFVFTRGGASDEAGMDTVGIKASSPTAILVLGAAFLGLVGTGFLLWASRSAVLRAAAAGLWLLAVLVGSVLRGGGIVRRSGEADADLGPAAKPLVR